MPVLMETETWKVLVVGALVVDGLAPIWLQQQFIATKLA